MKSVVFYVTRTIVHLLQMKGLFRVLSREVPHDHIMNLSDVCGSLSLKNIPQDSIRLRLFPFSLIVEATQW